MNEHRIIYSSHAQTHICACAAHGQYMSSRLHGFQKLLVNLSSRQVFHLNQASHFSKCFTNKNKHVLGTTPIAHSKYNKIEPIVSNGDCWVLRDHHCQRILFSSRLKYPISQFFKKFLKDISLFVYQLYF